jgi:hypothetical protein
MKKIFSREAAKKVGKLGVYEGWAAANRVNLDEPAEFIGPYNGGTQWITIQYQSLPKVTIVDSDVYINFGFEDRELEYYL